MVDAWSHCYSKIKNYMQKGCSPSIFIMGWNSCLVRKCARLNAEVICGGTGDKGRIWLHLTKQQICGTINPTHVRLNREGADICGLEDGLPLRECLTGALKLEESRRRIRKVCQKISGALRPNLELQSDHGSVIIHARARPQKTTGSYLGFKLFVEFVTC